MPRELDVWPRCPRCRALLSNGEVCRFVEATGYCWCCYPNRTELVDALLSSGEGKDDCDCDCHGPAMADDPGCPCREDEP